VELRLVWEKRCGRGDANQIYLGRVQPMDDPDYECAPFLTPEDTNCGSRAADSEVLEDGADTQETQNTRFKSSESCVPRTAETEVPEPQDLRTSKKEIRKTESIQKEVSQSFTRVDMERQTDDNEETELMDILDACELFCFTPETAAVFENAIERLYYSDSFRIGNATLPKSRVRAKLRRLDGMILREAERKLAANQERPVRNSTAYTMATIFNCVAESESDLMVDPYLNSLRAIAPPEVMQIVFIHPTALHTGAFAKGWLPSPPAAAHPDAGKISFPGNRDHGNPDGNNAAAAEKRHRHSAEWRRGPVLYE
jgi:hypothetical protein